MKGEPFGLSRPAIWSMRSWADGHRLKVHSSWVRMLFSTTKCTPLWSKLYQWGPKSLDQYSPRSR